MAKLVQSFLNVKLYKFMIFVIQYLHLHLVILQMLLSKVSHFSHLFKMYVNI